MSGVPEAAVEAVRKHRAWLRAHGYDVGPDAWLETELLAALPEIQKAFEEELLGDEVVEAATCQFTEIHRHNAPLKYGAHARSTMRASIRAAIQATRGGK